MKIVRMSTVGLSLDTFCRGLLADLHENDGYDVVALSSPDDALTALGQREGVRTIGIEMRRDISPLADLRSLWRLVSVLRRERPDMIHTMTPKAGLLGMIAARIAGVPLRIHTFTGLLFPTASGPKRQLLKFTDKLTCHCTTHIIAEGEGVRTDLTVSHISPREITVLGHGNVRGVDLDYYTPTPHLKAQADGLRRKLGIPADDKVLIFIGRFVGDKGLRELLKAFTAVRQSIGGIHLILVGDNDGSKDDIPHTEIAGQPNVHISGGWVDDVRPWLLMGNILVFPSYREGFPNVVLEAGAMGLPSVVTDINGSREIITDGVNGLIVPPRTVKPLADAIEKIVTLSGDTVRNMGRKARLNVEEKFSRPYVVQCLKDFYTSISTDYHADSNTCKG